MSTSEYLESAAQVLYEQSIEPGLVSGAQLASWTLGDDDICTISIGCDALGITVEDKSMASTYCLLKPLMSLGIGRLIDLGKVSWSSQVGDLVPCSETLCTLTIGDILSHKVRLDISDRMSDIWRGSTASEIDLLDCEARLLRVPLYSDFANWKLLLAIFSRFLGEDFSLFIEREVLSPLGIEDVHIRHWNECSRGGLIINGAMGQPGEFLPLLAEKTNMMNWSLNPGYGGYASMRSVVRLFSDVLLSSRGEGLLSRSTVESMVTPGVHHFDESLRRECQFGYGVFTDMSNFDVPATISSSSYGQIGIMGTSAVVADPDLSRVAAYHCMSLLDADTMSSWLRPAVLAPIFARSV